MPSFPLKNKSHNGANARGPLVKNMNATLGTLRKGYSCICGIIDALHSNSSSVMSCMSSVGCKNSINPTCSFDDGDDGGSGDGGGGDGNGGGGGGGDGDSGGVEDGGGNGGGEEDNKET